MDDAEGIDDDELAAQALAADSDAPLPVDALPWSTFTAADDADGASAGPLGDWYMPAKVSGAAGPGWRRRVAIGVVASIGLINAAGLCITYGPVTFG
jgi:hypothetical protein